MESSITVLLSTYNGEKFIQEQIDSILVQKNVEIKILVRDDGSSDNTCKIIENYKDNRKSEYVYFAGTLDAAIWGAELAAGDGMERIYVVDPTGDIEDDPNLTDKKFPGNPTKSYRSKQPLKIVAEVTKWEGHSPKILNNMIENLKKLSEMGIRTIKGTIPKRIC